ncbi:MAG: helix-turn-helix domain-containing protein [Clostridium sp.]|uniref:RNA polymerase sigma factor n=1 Tax=Clostridium sp. TaxID=1506 RepID=UPI003216A0DB
MVSICSLIKRAKSGDKESMKLLLIKFEPIINSLSWKIKDECGRTDLTIFFIKLVYRIKLINMINSSDGALVTYIQQSLYREYYRLNKTNSIIEVELTDTFKVDCNEYKDIEHEMFLNELVVGKVINEKQKCVLLKKYYDEYTDQEIATDLCISRQAVSKIHKVAIKHLKEYLN